jgi:hypothetical protein
VCGCWLQKREKKEAAATEKAAKTAAREARAAELLAERGPKPPPNTFPEFGRGSHNLANLDLDAAMLPLSAHKLYQLQQECSKQWLSGILRQRTGKALGGNGNRHAGLVLVQETCHMQVTSLLFLPD